MTRKIVKRSLFSLFICFMQIISLTDIAKQQSAQWKQKWKCEWRYWTIFLKYKQHWAAMRDGCAHLRPYIAKIRIVAFISLAQLKFTKHYNWKKTTFSNHDLWQRQTRLIAAFFVVIVWQTPYGLHMSFRDLPFAENQQCKTNFSHFEESSIC